MKKILAIIALALAVITPAQAWHSGYHNGWVAPFVVGGAVGYAVARPYYYPPYYYAPPPQVVYVQPPVYIQQPNPAPEGLHQISMLDGTCNCYKTVWVPNQ